MRRIVVGLDGSGSSAAALKWALRLARGIGSQVIAVYAIEEASPNYCSEASATSSWSTPSGRCS
jgi:nucleotide-binding universal stress UspA family protein